MKKINVKILTLCAIFAATSAVLSPWSINIGIIPIGFTHVSIFTAVGLLGAKYGTISQLVYVALGLIGIPIFAGFNGGIGALAGPTGGFIIGYIVCAFVTGIIIQIFGKSVVVLILAMYAGWFVTYLFGVCGGILFYFRTVEDYVLNAENFVKLLSGFVIPFLIGDVIKTAICVLLIKQLSPITKNRN